MITHLIFTLPVFAEGNRVIENTLQEYIAGKDARIGVAVIISGKNTVSINDNRDFPMMSVVKLPSALTAAHRINNSDVSLGDSIASEESDLNEDIYSPMPKMCGRSRNAMTVRELFGWLLVESNNSAADILLKRVSGTSGATSLMR